MPRFLSVKPDTRLITLPWSTTLAEWPTDILVALQSQLPVGAFHAVEVGGVHDHQPGGDGRIDADIELVTPGDAGEGTVLAQTGAIGGVDQRHRAS